MLRENLEEEAIIMKDVPNWKVGPQRGAAELLSPHGGRQSWGVRRRGLD
jgi:hypothetical protein